MNKKLFNERMGKIQKFSKGGMIRKIAGRHYFDAGGIAAPTAGQAAGTAYGALPTTAVTNVAGAAAPQIIAPVAGAAQSIAAPLGQAATGIASDFTAQNGYQAQLAPTQQTNYQPVITAGANAAANGYNQFNNNLTQEQALSGQLGQIAAGQGPNPAQALLNQQTGTNVANQAALMAGQRGAGANAGLIARQAAQQGAATQQQAVGQAATTQANQSLGALGQQAQLQQGIGSQITGEQNANTGLLGTGASAQNAQNNSNISNAGMVQGINSQVAQNNTNAVNQSTSGLLGGVGSALGLADGGEVQEPNAPNITTPNLMGGQPQSGGAFSEIGQQLKDSNSDDDSDNSTSILSSPSSATAANNFGAAPLSMPALGAGAGFASGGNVMQGPHGHVAAYLASGGAVPAMVSAGERYLNPEEVRKVVKEGANPLKLGKVFKGKEVVKGDSLKNDNIPEDLEEGGVVLPKHITKMKGPHKNARAELFVHKAVHMHAPKGGK